MLLKKKKPCSYKNHFKFLAVQGHEVLPLKGFAISHQTLTTHVVNFKVAHDWMAAENPELAQLLKSFFLQACLQTWHKEICDDCTQIASAHRYKSVSCQNKRVRGKKRLQTETRQDSKMMQSVPSLIESIEELIIESTTETISGPSTTEPTPEPSIHESVAGPSTIEPSLESVHGPSTAEPPSTEFVAVPSTAENTPLQMHILPLTFPSEVP
ncbi:hypothetical protein HNY73_005933 [Argiope bruennichi]|uniref:Uncharacterized protein n=1 Tax=Argiope bruennichi TaxID=94029 RepID=A0A8T0FKU5_ARGBR|nr:hypothetical protein HNY73_005933 [Argiope bruennichi]